MKVTSCRDGGSTTVDNRRREVERTAKREGSSGTTSYIRAIRENGNGSRFAVDYSNRNAEAADVGPEFVTNPINAYLLIKRLTSEWGQVRFMVCSISKDTKDVWRNHGDDPSSQVKKMMKENSAGTFIQNITARRREQNVSLLSDSGSSSQFHP